MGSRIQVELSLHELTELIDLIEMAQDHDISLSPTQIDVYKALQSKEAEELI